MHQHLKLATLVCTGVALGSGLALGVPTEPRTHANAQLAALSQARVVTYPGAGQAVAGPDSYPVTYSPQWLAVAQAAERERMARLGMVAAPQPVGYEQPSPEQDLAVEQGGPGTPPAEPQTPDEQLAEAEAPTS